MTTPEWKTLNVLQQFKSVSFKIQLTLATVTLQIQRRLLEVVKIMKLNVYVHVLFIRNSI